MHTTTWILIIFVLVTSILVSVFTKMQKKNKVYRYQKRPDLLTKNELNFYKSLLPIAQSKKLVICPKVRLADLIEPRKGESFRGAFNKIQAKHIDFVLCEPTALKPVLALELDDQTHDRPDRRERDIFVDKALADAGLPILHTRTTSELSAKISETITSKKPALYK